MSCGAREIKAHRIASVPNNESGAEQIDRLAGQMDSFAASPPVACLSHLNLQRASMIKYHAVLLLVVLVVSTCAGHQYLIHLLIVILYVPPGAHPQFGIGCRAARSVSECSTCMRRKALIHNQHEVEGVHGLLAYPQPVWDARHLFSSRMRLQRFAQPVRLSSDNAGCQVLIRLLVLNLYGGARCLSLT